MKLRRIVERMEALLSAEHRRRRRHADELKALLKRLKHKERELERELKEIGDVEAAETLQGKLKVVRAQRHKGVKALKDLRKSA